MISSTGSAAASTGPDATGESADSRRRKLQLGEHKVYGRGIISLSLVTAALGAGFAYIDGDAVAKLIDQPRGLVDFRLADLYRPLTGG